MNEESNQKTNRNTLDLWGMAEYESQSFDDDYMWQQEEQNPQDLPQDWNPTSPHRPVNYFMMESIQNARDLLNDRRAIIAKTHDHVEHASRVAFGIGAGLCAMNSILSVPFLIGSAAVNYINKRMTRKAYQKFDVAEDALHICNDYDRTMQDRQQAIENLRKTAQHLYYWEKTSRVSSTVVKFAAGEIIPLVGAVFSMLEVKDDLTKKPKTRPARTAHALQQTVDIMQKNLPHQSTPSFTP